MKTVVVDVKSIKHGWVVVDATNQEKNRKQSSTSGIHSIRAAESSVLSRTR
jgi:hypothetical protein